MVEDTEDLRRTLGDLLRTNGIDVIEARNEYEALGKVFSEQVDAIIADINLSGEGGEDNGGITLARLMKQSNQMIPIILISFTPWLHFPDPSDPQHEQKKKELNIQAILGRHGNSFDNDLLRELMTALQESAESKGA